MGNLNLLNINGQKDSPFNILITFQKETDIQLSTNINDESMDENNKSG